MSRKTLLIGILLLFVPLLLVSQQPVERVDLNVMHKIKTAELGGGGGFGGGGGGRGNAGPSSIPSWQITGYSGAMVEPTYMSIIGYPQAWSGGTDGPVTGEAIRLQLQTPADLDTWHGKLKGKIVLMGAGPLDLSFPTTALAHRYTDEEDRKSVV